MEITLFLAVVVAFCYCVVWIYQFVQLMLLSEDDFPGRYDKCLWTAVFILAFFPAPIAFMCWKNAYLEMRHTQRKPKNAE
ncbi:MAG: hypothetical protein RBS80_05640 [Thermoguttaceae bacterium]|jgi:hypothetical protein|nr:hypothetical protein [Thermoguttaceae bacterium]